MSNFTEIYNNIQAIIDRPDIEVFINSRINAGIRLLSSYGQFSDDLVELTLDSADGINPATYVQAVTLPTNFRTVSYIDYPDPTDKKPIEYLDIQAIGHRDSRFRSNAYYTSATTLHIKHDSLTPSFIFGYFATPAILSGTQSNWITNRVPELLEEIVIAGIRVILGDVEAATYITRLNDLELRVLMRDAAEKGQLSIYSGRR